MTVAYPLSWTDNLPRARQHEKGAFKTSLAGALDNVETSLRLFGRDSGKTVSDIVLSSNVTLGRNSPEDPGVAAWFTWEGQQLCIAVDRYSTPAANLQAIHHVLEARRVELRHGTLALVRASLAGFKALPAPPGSHWWQVLDLPRITTQEAVESAYRRLARAAHPDQGGSTEAMALLNVARAAALAELKS
jgi:hypothetical protein